MLWGHPHRGKDTKKCIWPLLSWKQSIWLSRKEIELLHVSLVLPNQWWDGGDSGLKNWLNAKRQSFSEVKKAEVEVENYLEDRVKTQSRRLSGIHAADPTQMNWKQDCEAVWGSFCLRLVNSSTDVDFRGSVHRRKMNKASMIFYFFNQPFYCCVTRTVGRQNISV